MKAMAAELRGEISSAVNKIAGTDDSPLAIPLQIAADRPADELGRRYKEGLRSAGFQELEGIGCGA